MRKRLSHVDTREVAQSGAAPARTGPKIGSRSPQSRTPGLERQACSRVAGETGGGTAQTQHHLMPRPVATCVRACAERFCRRCVTQGHALRMCLCSAFLKPGRASSVIVCSLCCVTLVSQDLKGKNRPLALGHLKK